VLTCTLTAGPLVALTNFAPGHTATGTGALTATTLLQPSWTLQAQDTGSGAGHMVAASTGCAGSDATLANPLQVKVTSGLGSVNSPGTISLSAANQTVASASSQILNADTLTTAYSQVIPANEQMRTGCVYSITVTYTLQ